MTTDPDKEELSGGIFPDWEKIIQEARELVESVLARELQFEFIIGGRVIGGHVRLVEINRG